MVDLIKQKKFLKKWYDKTADKYDSWGDNEKLVSENCKKEMEGIKKILDVKKGDYCLDVATGTGNYLILMAEKGAICYGIDLSPNILEVTKNKVNKLGLKNVKELIVGDSDKLPYSDNFFDWVTCIGMFEYYPIEHVEKILIEFQRVLKKNGKIIFVLGDMHIPQKTLNTAKDIAEIYSKKGFKIHQILEDEIPRHRMTIAKFKGTKGILNKKKKMYRILIMG